MKNQNIWVKYGLLAAIIPVFALSKNAIAYGYPCSPDSPYGYCVTPISRGAGDGSEKNTENRIYSGFIWELFGDQGIIPQFIIGIRSLEVKNNDNVSGADLSLRIRYQDKLSFDSVRLAYVGGERDIIGNIGAGYNFNQSSWLATAAVQGSYTRVSTDYIFGYNKFRYYAELNTLDKPSKVPSNVVQRPTIEGTCPEGTVLTTVDENGRFAGPAALLSVDSQYIINGKTCFRD